MTEEEKRTYKAQWAREHRKQHPERVREIERRYREKNRDARNAADRVRRASNVARSRERSLRCQRKSRSRFSVFRGLPPDERAATEYRIKQTMIWCAVTRARKLRLPCTITPNDLALPETCPVLGIPLFFTPKKTSPNTPSIDRIDPGLGYVPGNVAVISWRANKLKSNASREEIALLHRYIEHRLGQKPPGDA